MLDPRIFGAPYKEESIEPKPKTQQNKYKREERIAFVKSIFIMYVYKYLMSMVKLLVLKPCHKSQH